MSRIGNIFKWYLDSSLHVGLAVLSLYGVSLITLGLKGGGVLGMALFCGTVAAYNAIKYGALLWSQGVFNKGVMPSIFRLSLILAGISVFFLCFQPLRVILFLCLIGVLAVWYAVPVGWLPANLRNLSYVKIYLVGLVWALSTVLLPVFSTGVLTVEVIPYALQRWLLVVVLTIPFEIRDLKWDQPGLRTLPQVLGVKGAKVLGSLLLLVVMALELLLSQTFITLAWVNLGCFALTGILLWLSEEDSPPCYAAFWVEGVPVYWYAALQLVLFLQAFF